MATKTFSLVVNASLSGDLQSKLQAAQNQMNKFKNAAKFATNFDNNLSAAFKHSNNLADAAKLAMQMQGNFNTGGLFQSKLAELQNLQNQIQQYKDSLRNRQQLQQEYQKQVQKNSQAAADRQAAKDKLDALKIQLQQFQSAKVGLKRTSDAYKSLQQQIKSTKAEIKSANAELKAAEATFKSSQNRTSDIGKNLSQQISSLRQLQSALTAAGVGLNQLGAAEMRLQSQINSTTAALQRQAETAARISQAQMRLDETRNKFSEAQGNFQTAQNVASTILNPLKDAVQNASDYTYELANIKALTQLKDIRAGNVEKVNAVMTEMDKTFRRLGATTEYTSTEIAQSAGYFAMAGWNSDRIQSVMPAFINLATATRTSGHELARLADVISDDMTAAGLKAGENITLKSGLQMEASEYFADAFAYAVTNANLNRESLHEAVKYFAPVAKNLGLDVSEMMATTMLTANAGIKGSMMGTAFRSGLIRLVAPTKGAAGALAEMGMTMSDAQKRYHEAGAELEKVGINANATFTEKLKGISEYLSTVDKETKTDFINKVFGKNAFSAWAEIFSDPSKVAQIAEYAKYMESPEIKGYAGDTADVMRQSSHVQFELLKSSIDALENQIGTALLPAVTSLAQALTPIFSALAEFAAEHPRIVQALAAIAAGFAAIIVAGTGLAVAFTAFQFGAAQLALFRLGLIGAASGSAGLAAGLGNLTLRIGAAAVALKSMGLTGIAATLSGALKSAVLGVGNALKFLASGFGVALRAGLAFAFSPIGAALLVLGAAAYAVYKNWDKLSVLFESLKNTVGAQVSPAISGMINAFEGLKSAIGNALDAVAISFGKLFNLNLSGVTDALVKSFIVAAKVISQVLVAIVNFAAESVTAITKLFGGMADGISEALHGNWDAAKTAFRNANDEFLSHGAAAFKKSAAAIAKIPETTSQALDYYDKLKERESGALPSQAAVIRHRQDSTPEQIQSQLQKIQLETSLPSQAAVVRHRQDSTSEQIQTSKTIAEAIIESKKIQAAQPAAPVFDYKPGQNQSISTNLYNSMQRASVKLETANAQAQINALGNSAQANSNTLTETSTAQQTNNIAVREMGAAFQFTNAQTQAFTNSLNQNSNSAILNANSLIQNSNSAISNANSLEQNAAAATASTSSINEMSNSAASSTGNIFNLSNSSASAAGSVIGLGSAAQSAISALLSAGASAAATVGNAVGGALARLNIANNYSGGIYSGGQFLSWINEKGPEAIIPLDGSRNALELWQATGEILGVENNYSGYLGIKDYGLGTMENSLNPYPLTLNPYIGIKDYGLGTMDFSLNPYPLTLSPYIGIKD